MGCDYYDLLGGGYAHFSDSDDEFDCLCTFPHNDGEALTVERLRSLALLGAAVVMAYDNPVSRDDYIFIPRDIPGWILDGIRGLLPEEETQ